MEVVVVDFDDGGVDDDGLGGFWEIVDLGNVVVELVVWICIDGEGDFLIDGDVVDVGFGDVGVDFYFFEIGDEGEECWGVEIGGDYFVDFGLVIEDSVVDWGGDGVVVEIDLGIFDGGFGGEVLGF